MRSIKTKKADVRKKGAQFFFDGYGEDSLSEMLKKVPMRYRHEFRLGYVNAKASFSGQIARGIGMAGAASVNTALVDTGGLDQGLTAHE